MADIVQIYSAESPLLSQRKFLSQAWRDLVGSRETAVRLFRQYIAQRYRYSSLGLVWAFAPSAITALLLTLSKRSPSSSSTLDHVAPQFYAVFGLILAQTFLETFNTQRGIFSGHSYVLSRQRAPIEGFLLSGVADNLFNLGIKVCILVVMFLLFRVKPAFTLPLGLIGVGSIFMLGSGLGLMLAPLSALKRDIDNVMNFFPWVLFGLTPVFVEARPGSGLYQIYRFNPLTWIFEATRNYAYGSGSGFGRPLIIALVASGCLVPIAWLFCRIARPYVVERFLI